MASSKSPGQVLAATLVDNLKICQVVPNVGGQERQIILGVTSDGSFIDGMTLDAFVSQATQILLSSGRVYRYGNTSVFETGTLGGQRLATLAMQLRADPAAASLLVNLFGVGFDNKQGSVQSLTPSKLVGAVLADEYLWSQLPEIKYHARRVTFDTDFNLCHTGWNPSSGILVHAPEVVPSHDLPIYVPGTRAVDRLPPRLKNLLGEFFWRSNADLVNTLSMLLTGILINHFGDDPHPFGIIDGNQPGLGKTLLVQVIGRVLDDAEPPRIRLAREDDLEKRLCSELHNSRSSIIFIDNVRAKIESEVLEQNMLSPLLSFRVLGRSATIERPNTFLWFITSNLTAGTTDLIGRCVPIRQFHDGDPKARVFQDDPLAYASRHRIEILGELAGMILRWRQQGGHPGTEKHRCARWAATIGGILDANGLGEFFLANVNEAEMAMDQGLLDLASLAEHVTTKGLLDLYVSTGVAPTNQGRAPGQWLPIFAETQIYREKLAEGSMKSKATTIGIFLNPKVDRQVLVDTPDGPRWATLRRRDGAAKQKYFFFEIEPAQAHDGPACILSETQSSSAVANLDAGPLTSVYSTPGPDEGEAIPGQTLSPGNAVSSAADKSSTDGTPEWV